MAYKLSGTLNESARILVLNEDDWSVESNVERGSTNYSVGVVSSGTKTVIAVNNLGKIIGYSKVVPEQYGNTNGDRGVFGGGSDGSIMLNVIDYITISIAGDANDFGDLSSSKYKLAASSNGTNNRSVFGGGFDSNYSSVNTIEYITMTSLCNTSDFGDITVARNGLSASSNGTNDRGVFGGGFDYGTYYNIIDYITISSLANAVDFGDLTLSRSSLAATSNDTNNRAVFGGGIQSSYSNIIDYITISTTGNATDFGDLNTSRSSLGATSNGTNDRGVFGGGYDDNVCYNVIEYITISSISNTTDFGDLTTKRTIVATSNKNNNRGVFGGGYDDVNVVNTMEYITISSPGNAADFGDLTEPRFATSATSNA